MKSLMKVAVVTLVLTLAVMAFAGNTATLRLNNDADVSGTKLTAGEYKVTVDGTGPDVKVTFSQNGKVKATIPATFSEEKIAPEFSSVTTTKTADGVKVNELRLAKLKGIVKFQ